MQWIIVRETKSVIRWIEIYLVDSVIHLLKKWTNKVRRIIRPKLQSFRLMRIINYTTYNPSLM